MTGEDYLLLAAIAFAASVIWTLAGSMRYIARKEAEKTLRRLLVANRVAVRAVRTDSPD